MQSPFKRLPTEIRPPFFFWPPVPPMTRTDPSDETTIIATFSTRRNAEVARDYLADAGFETFVRADDAGGMHPELQRSQGVELVGMTGSANEARTALDEAGLLPEFENGDRTRPEQDERSARGFLPFTTRGSIPLFFLVVVVLILLGLFVARSL